MIVVSDTSPLNYLVMVGCVDILPALFEQVHCPPEVIAELQHARASEGVRRWAGAPPVWLHITRARMPPVASGKLGPGELHAKAAGARR